MQGFDQGTVRVLVKSKAFRNVTQKIQVFKSGLGLLPLFLGRSPLVRGALQVELEVHSHRTWQNVVHHHHPDILASTLDTVEAEKLWQQGSGVLVQVLEKEVNRKCKDTGVITVTVHSAGILQTNPNQQVPADRTVHVQAATHITSGSDTAALIWLEACAPARQRDSECRPPPTPVSLHLCAS